MRRGFVLLFAIGCTPTQPAPAPTSEPKAEAPKNETTKSDPPAIDGGEWYVGVLGQNGEPECPGGEQRWVDVEPTLGWTPTNALSDAETEWLDRPVVAHGRSGDPPVPRSKTTITAPCPTPQMRSDWTPTPRGFRVSRAGRNRLPYFTRDSLRPLAELTAAAKDTQLVVDFRNPVPVALEGVVIRVHYEGCRGKPDTTNREHPVGALAVGAGVQATFDQVVDQHGIHRAYSVQVVAKGEGVTFDLDVPVAVIGAPVKCPARN